MKDFSGSGKFSIRLGLITIIFITFNYGCVSSTKLKSIQSSPSPVSNATLPSTDSGTIQPATAFTHSLDTADFPAEVVWEMLDQLNKEEALIDLRRFSGDEPICIDSECYTIKNRLTGSEGLQWAKDYIYKELASLGYYVEFQDWSKSGYADQNIIAKKWGTLFPNEEVYFVAHIDGAKTVWRNRFPAADDNASGVADILEVARILSNYSFGRTLVFFFSTGEEQGTLGVKSYLNGLSQEGLSSIKYVINIDMVGYDEDHNGAMELWHGDHSPSLVLTQLISEIIVAYHLNLSPSLVVGCG